MRSLFRVEFSRKFYIEIINYKRRSHINFRIKSFYLPSSYLYRKNAKILYIYIYIFNSSLFGLIPQQFTLRHCFAIENFILLFLFFIYFLFCYLYIFCYLYNILFL